MSEKIEVGEYVRTKHFGINKIKGFYSDVYYDYIMVDDDLIKREDIIKSSSNIIDLIQENDYVNGCRVELSKYNELYIGYVYCGGLGQRTTEAYATFIKDMKVEDIDSIVTKEQFTEMEYKVNE